MIHSQYVYIFFLIDEKALERVCEVCSANRALARPPNSTLKINQLYCRPQQVFQEGFCFHF